MLKIQPLNLSSSMRQVITKLPQTGKIKIASDCFSYLDIDDNFIHHLHPLLDYSEIKKPDYFSEKNNHIGAHISITYPEENTQLDSSEENKIIQFEITGLFCADLEETRYFALKVEAPELIQIRKKYGLSDKMQLKGYFVGQHITIAYLENI